MAFLGWLAWTTCAHSTPEVDSELVGFDVDDEHAVDRRVEVRLEDDDVRATCLLRAYAEDHTVVGELSFTPETAPRSRSSRPCAPSAGPPRWSWSAAPPPGSAAPLSRR